MQIKLDDICKMTSVEFLLSLEHVSTGNLTLC